MSEKTCTLADCRRPLVARGLCRMHYLREWRANTVRERPSRQRKAPPVCPADHAHDLDGCWAQHGCRCDGCRHLRRLDRQRRRNRLIAYGRADQIAPELVSVVPVRDHIQSLRDQGYGLERIAAAAQVSRSVAADVVYGRRGTARTLIPVEERRVRAVYAARLLAVTPEDMDAAVVPAVGTTRRLQALVAIGYTQTQLAQQLGVHVGNLSPIVLGHSERVSAGTYSAVRDLFTRLWEHPQQGSWADHARRIAARHGWLGPLAWDDIDGDAEPDEVAVIPEGRMTSDEIADEVEWLRAAGENAETIAAALDMRAESVSRRLRRAGRAELASFMEARTAVAA